MKAVPAAKKLISAKNYEAAIALLNGERSSNDPELLYALGDAYVRTKRKQEAIETLNQALTYDPLATKDDFQLLASRPKDIQKRQKIHRFILKFLPEILEKASFVPRYSSGNSVFFYWDKGIAAAPDVVRMCHTTLIRSGTKNICSLDRETAIRYVNIPPIISHKTASFPAFFSDALRVALLATHGGIWVDATCLPNGDITEHAWAAGEFVGVFHSPTRISNWHMASRSGHVIPCLMLAALEVYWRENSTAIHYHFFHHIFESLSILVPAFAESLEASKKHPAKNVHVIQKMMLSPYNETQFKKSLAQSYIHKLTHKFEKPEGGQPSVIEHLLQSVS